MFGMIFVVFIYLIGMKLFQNYEYSKHKRRTINLAIAITTSIFFCFIPYYQTVINEIAKRIDVKKFKLKETEISHLTFGGKDT
jgi:hypothetical protein